GETASEIAKSGNFESALNVARGIEKAFERDVALSDIGGFQAKAGEFGAACQISQLIEDPKRRRRCLGDIARAHEDAGDYEAARSVFADAISGIESFMEEPRNLILRDMAFLRVKAGDFDGAIDIVNAAGDKEGREEML